MIMLMLLLASILKVEGNSDWRESAFKIQSFDCYTPTMIKKLHLPDHFFIPTKKLTDKLAAAQPAWFPREEYIHEVYLRTGGGKTAAKHSRVSPPTDCNRKWCVDGPRVYLLDDQVQACPFKRIRAVNLRPEANNMMISDELAMLFNGTKTEVLLLPGCPQLTLHHTALGTVSITFDKRVAGLPEVVSLDVRSDQDLIPTLRYLEHQNAHATNRIQCFDSIRHDEYVPLRSHSNIRSSEHEDDPELGFAQKPQGAENRAHPNGTFSLKCWKPVSV